MNYTNSELTAKRRAEILVRDSHTCQRCKLPQSPAVKLEIHHIIPRRDGGTSDPANLITYCVNCHRDEDRDRSKPHCTVSLSLSWSDYDLLRPRYLDQQLSLKQYVENLLATHLQELRADPL